jgi:hypothetical protein
MTISRVRWAGREFGGNEDFAMRGTRCDDLITTRRGRIWYKYTVSSIFGLVSGVLWIINRPGVLTIEGVGVSCVPYLTLESSSASWSSSKLQALILISISISIAFASSSSASYITIRGSATAFLCHDSSPKRCSFCSRVRPHDPTPPR